MDEPPLPTDIGRWPRDPFALLGVKMGSDLKSVKRAYQRLIRIYRPEHHPVEFRRIREAYESAQSMTGWFSTVDADVAEEIMLRGPDESPNPYDDLPPIPLAPEVPSVAAPPPSPPEPPLPVPEVAAADPEPIALGPDSAAPDVGESTLDLPPVAALPPIAEPPVAETLPDISPVLELPAAPPPVAEPELTLPEAQIPPQPRPTHSIPPPPPLPPVVIPPVAVPPVAAPQSRIEEYARRPYEQCLAEAWRPVLDGDSHAAYCRLADLCRAQPGRSETYLALYWLLRLTPTLEVERKPCDWLTECLAGTDDSAAALELYRREIVRRPAEALTPRCTGLVRSPNARRSVAALIEWRWRAALAVEGDAPSLVRHDLDALRKTRLSYDSGAWLRVLWAVVETGCWSRAQQAKQLTADAMRELERYASAPDVDQDALSQLDYMTETSACIAAMGDAEAVESLRRLIARSWSMSASDLYVLLTRFVEPYLSKPDYLLSFLTLLAQRGALVLGRYGQVLQLIQHELGRNLETFWTPATAENAILDFLAANNVKIRYDEDLRKLLLEFCLYERMPPELIAESIAAGYEFKESVRWLPERLMQDWPLRFTYATMNLMTV